MTVIHTDAWIDREIRTRRHVAEAAFDEIERWEESGIYTGESPITYVGPTWRDTLADALWWTVGLGMMSLLFWASAQ